MAVIAQQKRFKRYRYTDDDGGHWTVKVESDWGDSADSGFAVLVATDPPFTNKGRYHTRFIGLQDPQTGRVIKRPVGNPTAAAFAAGAYTTNIPVVGLEDPVPYTRVYKIGEHLRPDQQVVFSAGQPSETA